MKGFLKTPATRVAKGQGGFTLIEMIVVVGIIAVLAAVIIPNIGRFIGSGAEGAKTAEQESVQTAMNAMMAELSLIAVDANATTSTNSFAELPSAATALGPYLQNATTVYFYCWNAEGQITNNALDASRTSATNC